MVHETSNTDQIRADLRELDILHPPRDWERILGVLVLDPDGWRREDRFDYEQPISREEFLSRASESTTHWPRRYFETGLPGITAQCAGTAYVALLKDEGNGT